MPVIIRQCKNNIHNITVIHLPQLEAMTFYVLILFCVSTVHRLRFIDVNVVKLGNR